MKFRWTQICAVFAVALFSLQAQAQGSGDFPSRAIKIIVPGGAATAPDLVARALAEELTKQMNVSVTVDNREGAGGTVAYVAAAKSPADGYTLLLASSTMVTSVHMVNPQPFDPVKDFTSIIKIGEIPLLAVVGSDTQHKNWKDLVTWSKANPGKMNFGTMGKGSASHLYTAMLQKEFSFGATDVAYKSVSQGIVDTSTGKLDFYLANLPPTISLLQAGKLRAVGIGSATRLPALPDVPTFAELTGKPGYRAVLWYAAMVPAGTPQAIVSRLVNEVTKAAASPVVKQRIEAAGGVMAVASGKDMHDQVEADFNKFGGLVKELGLGK